jgi:circadian clock protein KaiB
MNGVRLRLYVTGRTARSEAAINNLHAIVEEHLPEEPEVEIVDVLEEPELAEEHHILVTPTLDKILPMPARRIIGDLSDADAVVRGLGLGRRTTGTQEI